MSQTYSDSSGSDHEEGVSMDVDGLGELSEVRPPSVFDPLAPLSLPFGPRTTAARHQLAQLVGYES